MINITKDQWYKLQEDFINRFPLESLKEMPIEQYTNLNRSDSFCYWLESETNELGSIWGGSSYKFGIYKYNKEPQTSKEGKDNEYAWYGKLGKDRNTAYETIRQGLYEIASAATKGDFEAVESNPTFGDVCKWKIAFIYSGMKLIPLYKKEMLQKVCQERGMNATGNASICEMQRFLNDQKMNKDLYDFYNDILAMLDVLNADGNVWMYMGDEQTFNQEVITMGDSVSDSLVDYSSFNSRDEVINTYRAIVGNKDSRIPNAYWQFIKDVKNGDIVVVFANRKNKKNSHILYGWGIITSDLINDLDSKSPLQRRVEWKQKLENPKQETIVSNSLFFHGMDKAKTKKIKQLLGIASEPLESNDGKDMEIQKYITLLQENHNLVLTGAPGTGKTFLAKQIAKAMGADETTKNFVQFHPSYDYTDFVEGLRPSKEGDGFERRDGVFKAFCKVALQNYIDSDKSTKVLENEKDVAEAIDEFANDAIENSTILKTAGGKEFSIIDINDRHCTISIPSNPKVNMLKLRLKELKAILESDSKIDSPSDVQKILSQKWKTQDDTYLFILYQRIKPLLKKVQHVAKIEKKNFVFIIDEINRGDLSKIFGELFFSIDPGYRGTKGIVQTQYQNIVDEDDEYAEGFYIPENVYIIATMNDIDRSVESMDFAMRRRFTWVEVTPDDRVEMLDNLPEKNAAVRRMKSLNAVIAATEGLGPAFQIGPAYFLKLKNGDFNRLWNLNIEPLLKEYLRGFRKSDETLKEFKKAYNSVED